MDGLKQFHHFLLTRFNLLLWTKDKAGHKVRSSEWLDHRFALFERYCLPSIMAQTCQEFEWIVLFDSSTPERYRERITEYQKGCPQLVPVFVSPENGRRFADIFREDVVKRLNGERVITTYLDNDDALNIRFIEDLQQRVQSLPDGTFVYYTEGYQYFTDHQYLMRIRYPRNHFASVVENGSPATVKTIYGYGSHYYIDKIKDAKIEYVKNQPMWCEVIHEKNMGNDAYFLGALMVRDKNLLETAFGLQEKVHYGFELYLFRFLPRYLKTLIRRCGYFIFRNRFQ